MKTKFFLLLLTLISLIPLISAQENNPENPTNVEVAVYVLNIGKFDVSSGSYVIDFYLSMKCPGRDCFIGDFEFMNGRASSVEKIIDEPNEKFYRIQANLATNIDLKHYPFDSHSLTIELEDKENSIEKQVYIVDQKESGIDSSVTFVGWGLKGWKAEVLNHSYPVYSEVYSRYVFHINIERLFLASLLKAFLPVIFIVIVALLALLIAPDKIANRLGINTATLLASVMFHLNVTSSIPPVGYLTLADKFMIATYISLGVNLFSSILLMQYTESKKFKEAEKIHKRAMIAVPLITIILYALIFIIP